PPLPAPGPPASGRRGGLRAPVPVGSAGARLVARLRRPYALRAEVLEVAPARVAPKAVDCCRKRSPDCVHLFRRISRRSLQTAELISRRLAGSHSKREVTGLPPHFLLLAVWTLPEPPHP